MNKQATLKKLSQVRLAINHVLRQRLVKRADSITGTVFEPLKELYKNSPRNDILTNPIVAPITVGPALYNRFKNKWNRKVVNILNAPAFKQVNDWNKSYIEEYNKQFSNEDAATSSNDLSKQKAIKDWNSNYIKQNPYPKPKFYNWYLP